MKQRYWLNTSTKNKTRRRPDKSAGLIYHAPLIDNPALQQAKMKRTSFYAEIIDGVLNKV